MMHDTIDARVQYGLNKFDEMERTAMCIVEENDNIVEENKKEIKIDPPFPLRRSARIRANAIISDADVKETTEI
jgi:hypothetical protein